MKTIYYFNPQNDLALATGGINYVAPPFAIQMAHDLAVLPAFIAEPGSLIITDDDLDAEWLENLNATFGLDVHAINRNELWHVSDYRIMPWGWCLDLRRRLVKWGADRQQLPSKDEIYHLRGLSHRRISINMHLQLRQLLDKALCPVPVELAVPEEVRAFVAHYGECYIKTPWSSSGRGIYHTINGTWTPELEQWCHGALKRQGSLLCEVALDKVLDFAVEFYAHNGKSNVRGYSIFNTDSHSQYDSGMVAQTDILHQRITAMCPEFDTIVNALTQVLDMMVAPHYNGWLGVDMLLYNVQSAVSIGINPCVELNLRPTMGAVTCMLGDKLLAPGKTGMFRIEQRNSSSEPWPKHETPVLDGGHMHSGTVCLTTPNPSSLYRAILTIDR